jgi:hypothetical protein
MKCVHPNTLWSGSVTIADNPTEGKKLFAKRVEAVNSKMWDVITHSLA